MNIEGQNFLLSRTTKNLTTKNQVHVIKKQNHQKQ